MMHRTLTIKVNKPVKYHQWKMMKFKLLVQVLHQIKKVTNLQKHFFSANRSLKLKLKYISYFSRILFIAFFVNTYRSSITPLQ